MIYHSILGPNGDLIASLLYRSVLDQTEPGRIILKVVLSLFNGEAAVDVFFVISGIVLLRSLRPMLDRSGDGAWVARAFLLRRVVRLWPLLAVVLAVHVASFAVIDRFWPGLIHPFTLDDLLSNLALSDFPVNGATWTLRWELIGAPLILLWFFAGRRFGVRAILPAMLAVIAVVCWVPSLIHNLALVTTLPFMAAGMAIESGFLAPVIRSLRGPAALAGALGAAFAIFATELFLPLANGGAWRHLLGLLVSVTVLVAILEAEIPGPLTAVLLARPSQFLGRISFSLYLWNVPIFELLFGLLFVFGGPDVAHHHPIECAIIVGLSAIILASPIAAASERWLEQTSIRVGRALTRPPRRRNTPLPAKVKSSTVR